MATLQVIIDNALYKSLYDRQYQTIDGDIQNAALNTLIGILDESRYLVPFNEVIQTVLFSELSNTKFTAILQIEYILDGIKYPLFEKRLIEFNREAVVIGLKSPPIYYYFDNLPQTIQVYPEPTTGDEFIIHGYKSLEGMELTDIIPVNMPRFMRDYIEYELAMRLCAEYSRVWSQEKEVIRGRLELKVKNAKDVDVTPPINIEMGTPNNGRGEFPWFYYSTQGI